MVKVKNKYAFKMQISAYANLQINKFENGSDITIKSFKLGNFE